jgi:hypothetical protein
MAKETQFSNDPPHPEGQHADAQHPAPEGAQHPAGTEGAPQAAPAPSPAGEAPHQVDLGTHAADTGDSAINLGADVPVVGGSGSGSGQQMDMSGVSAIEWAALVEEDSGTSGVKPAAPPGPAAADAATAAGAAAAETAAQPQGAGPADLDVLDTLVASPGPGSGSGVGSAVDYGAKPPQGEAASSGVDLFAPAQVDSALFSSDVSGPSSGDSSSSPSSESGINLVAEDVILEESADLGATPAGGESGSARDLIAEAVESGVDLGASTRPPAEGPPAEVGEGSDVISLEGPPGQREESSSVDLGAVMEGETAGRVAPPPGSGVNLGADVPSQARPGSAHEEPSASTVDLGSSDLPQPAAGSGSGEEMASAGLASDSAISASDSGINFDMRSEAAPPRSGSGIDLEPVSAGALAAGAAAGAADDEGVVAEEAEEEEPVAEAEEEEHRPAPPPRAASRGPAWVGGGLLGAGAGVVGCLALWLFGVQPPESWRLAGGKTQSAAPVAPRTGPGPGAAAPAVSFEDAVAHLHNGDFARAATAMEQVDESKPEQLAKRGELRWLSYLQKQRQANAAIKANDQPVQQAVADLKKANTADALFWLGQIQQETGDPKGAQATYGKAVEQFRNNPAQRRIFDAALERLADEEGPAGAGAALPWRGDALLALLIALQPPAPMPGEAPAAGDEAGFEFWKAVGLARQQKYAEALQELDRARALHQQRRFSRLRKAQNPLSDPTEEIFLRCCTELKRYWQMEGRLSEDKYLTQANRRNPVQALDKLIAAARQGAGAGAAAMAVAQKLVQAKVISNPQEVGKGIDKLLAERQEAGRKVAALQMTVKESQDKAAALDRQVKQTEEMMTKALAKAGAELKAAETREAELKAKGTAAEATLRKAADQLVAAKYLSAEEAKDPRVGLPRGLGAVIRTANAADPSGALRRQEQTIAELRAEVRRRAEALKQQLRPEEMLPLWLALLQQDRSNQGLAARAARDADRVMTDPAVTAEAKAKAEVIQGLALRNSEKVAEARTMLEKGRAGLGAQGGEWRAQADAALKELANPGARFLQEADELERQGKWAQAADALGKGMAATPAARGRLLARRALLELEAAKAEAQGPLQPGNPRVEAARKDAEAATKLGQAEGSFAAGRIAEELGQWDLAAKLYRQAVAAHPALDAAGSRYRVALARVLLQATQAEAPAAPAPPKQTRPGRAAQAPRPLGVLAVLVSLGVQAPPELPPVVSPAQQEAEKLADEVLAAPEDAVPFDVRAQALAIKGLYTRALTAYAEGLRPYLPPRYSEGLLRMVRSHPGLSRPDSKLVPDPLLAEKYYSAGLNFYFARNYRNAEKEFLAAIENDSQDARFFYYLGLSRLLQGKRGAAEDFDQGARLEARGRPAPAAVSAALERVQGPARRRVNEARMRPPEVVGR